MRVLAFLWTSVCLLKIYKLLAPLTDITILVEAFNQPQLLVRDLVEKPIRWMASGIFGEFSMKENQKLHSPNIQQNSMILPNRSARTKTVFEANREREGTSNNKVLVMQKFEM